MKALLVCVISYCFLTGCAPVRFPLSVVAETDGMTVHHIEWTHFPIAIYEQAGDDGRQFVFIEGDGRPWDRSGRQPNADPTPGHALTYDLMKGSPVHGFYITRPCYFGLVNEHCSSNIWTSDRYAPIVVDNLLQALRGVLDPAEPVTIVGYSGGAALAILVAQDLVTSDSVVAVAGLVDLDAWTRHHGYEALTGSVDPARLTLRDDVTYLLLHGNQDANIPLQQNSSFAEARTNVTLHRIYDFDHTCCWSEQWPTIWRDIVTPSLIPSHTSR